MRSVRLPPPNATVFGFGVVQSKNPQTGAMTRGKISLVDMAGSERVKRSEVTGEVTSSP